MRMILIPVLVAACVTDPAPIDPPACAEDHREVGEQEAVGAGFTADQVLDFSLGVFEEDAWFEDGQDPQRVTIEVTYADGRTLACEERGVPSTPTSTSGSPGTTDIDRLDVEVDVHLKTEDGRLDERATVFLSSTDGLWASANYELEQIAGSLVLDPAADRLRVEAAFSADDAHGEVRQEPISNPVLVWPFAAVR